MMIHAHEQVFVDPYPLVLNKQAVRPYLDSCRLFDDPYRLKDRPLNRNVFALFCEWQQLRRDIFMQVQQYTGEKKCGKQAENP